jgi:hypothetical protein
MKSKIWVVGLIGLLMTVGLVLAGCDNRGPCNNDRNCRLGPSTFNHCSDSGCEVNK